MLDSHGAWSYVDAWILGSWHLEPLRRRVIVWCNISLVDYNSYKAFVLKGAPGFFSAIASILWNSRFTVNDHHVMLLDFISHVFHATVANLYSVFVENFMKFLFMFFKCFMISRRKIFPTFVYTFLRYGRLNQIFSFLFFFLLLFRSSLSGVLSYKSSFV